ncbi:MAG: tetratricopeptide repeat protein [Candidatus Obscuribacterales bacterium]|nr:tetratricopeptide repeat protein [Candidatus Obscuribacterales bacterium]
MRTTAKFLGRLIVSLTIACAFGYGFYGLFTYALPMSKHNLTQARTSYVADESEILLNGAAAAYDDERLAESAKVLEMALEKLINRKGEYSAAQRAKLERIFFLLGKTYHRMEMFDKAIQNYEDTLRMNPNHLPAKYNLEMIQMEGGGGGAGGKKPQSGKTQPKI